MATIINANGVSKVLDTADLSTNNSLEALGPNRLTARVLYDHNNNSTPTIVDELNVATVTYDGSAKLAVTFTTPMDNANYTVVGNALRGDDTFAHICTLRKASRTINGFDMYIGTYTGGSVTTTNLQLVNILVSGGKA